MAKKIEVIVDVNTDSVEISSDKVLTLTEQLRILKKEIQKVGPGKEQDLLIGKFNDINDELDKTNLKSKEFLGALGTLPGPVGAFAGSLDGAINQLKSFTSFSFSDIKKQVVDIGEDFMKIGKRILDATGITKIYTVTNNALAKSFQAVGIGEQAAATGAKALAGALAATGVLLLVAALAAAVDMLMKFASGEEEAAAASAKLNGELESQNELLDLNAASAKRRNAETVAIMKAQGKTEGEIRKKLLNDSYADYERAFAAEADARKLYNDNLGKANAEDLKKLQKNLDDKVKATKDSYSAYIVLGYTQKAEENKIADEKNKQLLDKNKAYNEKVKQDNQTADTTLLDLKRENAALAIKDERLRQDKELENQKLAEEDKIKALLISDEKKKLLIKQIDTKYLEKQKDVNTKRKEEDEKSEKEILTKLEEIRISGIANLQEKEKAELQKGYNNTKADLDKYLEDKKISQEQYNTAILNLNAALAAGIKKIDDDKDKEDQDKRLKKLDDELKFLQIKGEALRVGTEAYYENQRAILDAAEKRELENLELTEAAKQAIIDKYAALRKKSKEEEVAANWMVVSKLLDATAAVTSAIASSYDEEAKTSKEAFEKRKKLQKATAIMSAASGIIQILTQPSTLPSPADWIVKGLNAVALGITTGIQIKNIDKVQFEGGGGGAPAGNSAASLGKNYADGGMIGGRRHAQGGTLIEAEQGEAIMTRGAVTMFQPLLSAMNQMGGGTSFSNGLTTRPDIASVSQPAQDKAPVIMKTYVVSNELTTEAEKQARLKDLSTL